MPPRVRAGNLRQPITIQRPVKTPDGVGGNTEAYETFITTRAAIWPVSGKEIVKNAKITEEITHQVRTRYQPGINSGMKVVFVQKAVTRTLEILHDINPEEKGVLIDIMCQESV